MPSDLNKEPDPYLDLDESAEDLGEEVQRTNTELEKLKRQLEDIEKQKLKLEELKRRQDELDTGRSDMLDKLTRSLGTVERESEETRKRLEQLNVIHNTFTRHLRDIEAINPKAWTATELPKELSKALSAVEDARADYVNAQARLRAEAPAGESSLPAIDPEFGAVEEQGFGFWFKSGFAFTLPLQILILVVLVVWFATGTR